MRTSKYISLLIIIGATLFFSQCEVQRLGCIDPQASNYDVTADIDDGSCVYGSFPPYNNCESDFSGNLVVNNQTEFQLVLYNNGVQQTCIPAYDSNFIVNIPNQQLEVCNLQLWKSDDVAEQQPEEDKVFRQWKVALSNTSDESERASWLISNSESWLGTGTIELNYPKIDEYGQSHDYQVDIFLNSKSGAKLASLQGGVSNKLVSVDYGIHVLYFRYWYSNPTNGSVKELGWLEHQGVVLNAQHLDYKVEIPVYQSFEGKYAYMKVINNFEHAVAILADGALIENIAKVEGSTQGLSVIPAKNSTEFLIPMKESYTITVKSAFNSTVYETFTGVNLLQDETTILTTGEGLQSIIVD
ncbi:MAG: hypothetical protein MI922_19765, partial [Bacteroidales bacterium]|nr:hypothetical protein [Bacteroidales bacterium]